MWPFQSEPILELEKLRDCYDYIIVGAGSAGCVLASRLSENPAVSVLVIERGRSALDWASHVPLLSADFKSDGSRSRKFYSTPQSALDNKPTEIAVGNAFGGSSKINGMIYTRALPGQFSDWTLQGRKGWSYDELYPYFLKSEGATNRTNVENFHNLKGEWKNRSISTDSKCVFASAHNTIRAAKDLGFPYISDVNSPHEPIYGIAKLDHNIDSSGRRSDTASAFLPISVLASRRDRLHVCTDTLVTRLEFDTEGENLVAKGVVIEPTDQTRGQTRQKTVSATKEIILCAGALGTPQILMLSGVGPRQHLEDMGIEVKNDLPGVGSNLQDHLGLMTTYNVPLKDSMIFMQKDRPRAIRELIKYLIFGTGIFLCPVHELSLFVNTELLSENCENLDKDPTSIDKNDPKYLPDIELLVIAYGDGESKKADGEFALCPSPVRPYSRGTVRLKSQDPRENPIVDPNFLADPRDRIAAHKGLELSLKLRERLAANGYPIEDISVPSGTSPSELDKYIMEFGRSFYHYTSTCRMAPEDDTLPGVVDDELRVHGIEGLRIVDASVFPGILATHLQATVVAMAEKCSDMLTQRDAEKGVDAGF